MISNKLNLKHYFLAKYRNTLISQKYVHLGLKSSSIIPGYYLDFARVDGKNCLEIFARKFSKSTNLENLKYKYLRQKLDYSPPKNR